MLSGDQFESASVQRARANVAGCGVAGDLLERFRGGVFSWDELLLLLSQVVVDGEWRERAACQGMDVELFFPVRGQSTDVARGVCGRCEVQRECGEYALESGEPFGVWGGVSARGRRRGVRVGKRFCVVCGGELPLFGKAEVCGGECGRVRRREAQRRYEQRRVS